MFNVTIANNLTVKMFVGSHYRVDYRKEDSTEIRSHVGELRWVRTQENGSVLVRLLTERGPRTFKSNLIQMVVAVIATEPHSASWSVKDTDDGYDAWKDDQMTRFGFVPNAHRRYM